MSIELMIEAAKKERDEGQKRMDAAAEALLNVPHVYARLHEYDDACQPEPEARRM